ncbi:MAG: hypothetical protein ACFCUU_17720, partial [Cyclobacteriaceae bacterium]
FLDSKYKIVTYNNYLINDLQYEVNDLKGNHPELLFKTSLKKKIEALENDANFILTGFSIRHETKIIDKFGANYDVRFVITKIEHENKVYHTVLFNRAKSEVRKRILQKLFQVNQGSVVSPLN